MIRDNFPFFSITGGDSKSTHNMFLWRIIGNYPSNSHLICFSVLKDLHLSGIDIKEGFDDNSGIIFISFP